MECLRSLCRRWSFWHTVMTMLAVTYFFEASIIFGEFYWWKYTAKPGSVEGLLTDEVFNQARRMQLHRLSGHFLTKFFHYGWYVALLGYGCLEWMWMTFAKLMPKVKDKTNTVSKALYGCLFYAGLLVIDHILFKIISKFIISLVMGTPFVLPLEWVLEHVVGKIIDSLFVVVVLALLERKLPRGVYLLNVIARLLIVILSAIAMVYDLCSTGSLLQNASDFPAKEAILALAQRVGIDPNHLYLQDKVGNAAAVGFGFIGYIFISNSMKELSIPQLVAFVAHELGHWRWAHSAIAGLLLTAQIILTYSALYLFRRRHWYRSIINESYGEPLEVPFALSFAIFTIAMTPIDTIVAMLLNLASWAMEISADRFAVQLGYGQDLIEGLAVLYNNVFAVLLTYGSPIYGLLYQKHPPNNVRFSLIRSMMK